MPKRIKREIREMLKRDIAMLARSPWLSEPLQFIIKRHGKTMRAMQRAADKSGGGQQTRRVTAKVIAVLPEFKQARLDSPDGWHYAITDKTPGIDWQCLREGQQIECTVTTTDLPRVIEARLLEPNSDHTY